MNASNCNVTLKRNPMQICNTHSHDITIFKNLHRCNLRRDDIGIIFKNLHSGGSRDPSTAMQALSFTLLTLPYIV